MCYGAQWIVHLQERGGADDHVMQSHQLTCGGYKSSVQSIHADTPGRMTLALPLKPVITLYRRILLMMIIPLVSFVQYLMKTFSKLNDNVS